MLFVDSAHDLIRHWNARNVFKNEPAVLEATQQCGYFAFCNQRQEVPREVLDIPELHQAWVKGWRAAHAKSRNTTR